MEPGSLVLGEQVGIDGGDLAIQRGGVFADPNEHSARRGRIEGSLASW